MVQACSAFTPAAQNPGVMLGLALGVLQKHGRDKVTFVTSPKLHALGAWFEQLIAESTGKKGKGIVPIDGETLAAPSAYGSDRVFVYLHDHSEDAVQVAALSALEKAGHPSVRISLESAQSVAQEFFRWEIATAVAGAVIGINPFDQPDVEAAKIATKRLLEKGTDTKQDKPLAENDDLQFFGDSGLQSGKVEEVLAAHLRRLVNNDYFAVNAFIAMSDANVTELEALRLAVRDGKHVATTLGFGPRFLHSTGQLHKGGANNGVFLEVTADDADDVAIPGMKAGFRELLQAQALGDAEVLLERKRRVLRVKLRSSDKLPAFKKLVMAALK
jgi:transaldolase / glucose-6-phosphate isomerase